MITTWTSGSAEAHMDEQILLELGEVVRSHPWWNARSRLVLDLLKSLGLRDGSRILDAGCGWGVTLRDLEGAGYRATGMDISRATLEFLDAPERTLIEADLSKPFPDDLPKFDAVLALDVIEHLDDDAGAIRRLGELLAENGRLILSVPARPDLYSTFDRIQGHRRRYLPETLSAAINEAGLVEHRQFWWGQWMLPLLRRQRLWGDSNVRSDPGETPDQVYRRYLRLPSPLVSWALPLAFELERPRALRGQLTSGTSLFAVVGRT